MTDNMRGAALMMASMAAFTLNDTCVKALAGSLPLFQVIFLRGFLTTVLTAGLAWRMGAFRGHIPPRDRGLVALRLVAEVASAYFFLMALYNMPLANVTAILQSLPLVLTLTAALLFREPLGWRRLSAILIGLVGVLLIVRPGSEGFTLYSVYALLAVVFVTMRDLCTRRLSRETPSMLVTFLTSGAVMVSFGIAAAFDDWVPVGGREGLLILGAAGFVFLGYLCSIMVMRVGEIAFVTPFRYTGLVWALILGWVVFGDWPSNLTLLGAAIVVASGIFTLWREGQLARAARAQARS